MLILLLLTICCCKGPSETTRWVTTLEPIVVGHKGWNPWFDSNSPNTGPGPGPVQWQWPHSATCIGVFQVLSSVNFLRDSLEVNHYELKTCQIGNFASSSNRMIVIRAPIYFYDLFAGEKVDKVALVYFFHLSLMQRDYFSFIARTKIKVWIRSWWVLIQTPLWSK